MSAETTAQPYAICTKCEGLEFASKDEASEHSSATMAPVSENSTSRSGHSWRVVNPSAEEVAENAARRAVGRAIDDAMDRAFEDLDREIERGEVTEEAVTKELRHFPDFGDGWDEWRREAGA